MSPDVAARDANESGALATVNDGASWRVKRGMLLSIRFRSRASIKALHACCLKIGSGSGVGCERLMEGNVVDFTFSIALT